MPDTPPTEAEVDHIIAAEKVISEDIKWVIDASNNRRWVSCRATVVNAGGWDLTLHGKAQMGSPQNKRSYSLSWNLGGVGYRIFSLDINGNHRNQRIDRNRWRNQTHKQRWRDEYPNFAFTPTETIPEGPVAAFYEFCAECNIVFAGRINSIPTA